MANIQDTSSGRTSPVPSPRTRARTSKPSSKRSSASSSRRPRCLCLKRHDGPTPDLYMGDGWSVAYRTLDAQYWGVPQRRRRIYLVADLAGRSAGKILFESEGLSGYSAEGFRTWQRAAGSFDALRWSDRLWRIQRQSDRGGFFHTRCKLWNVHRSQRHRAERPGRRPHGHHRGSYLHAPSRSAPSALRHGVGRILHRAFRKEPHHRL